MRVLPFPDPAEPGAEPPEVVLVGRPNVGKSTLFNRLARRRQAIVHPQPGVTRDRLTAPVHWAGRVFQVVDTGGLTESGGPDGDPELYGEVRDQVLRAVRRASLVLLVVDGRAGLTPHDSWLADVVRRAGRPCLVVVNKVDHPGLDAGVHEFSALGLGEVMGVSAESGRGVGELLDRIVAHLPAGGVASDQEQPPVRVAVVGRPNVGKSSLINAIVGDSRLAVHPQPGTTRDAVDVPVRYRGHPLVMVDTAGIRRKARPGTQDLEQLAVLRALGAMRRADVAVVVIDAGLGVAFQEARLAGQAARLGLAVVLAVNKWDLVEPRSHPHARYTRAVQQAAAGLDWAPVVFISALKGWGIDELLDRCLEAAEHRRATLGESELQAAVLEAQARRPPPARRGKGVRIVGGRQVATNPPTIALRVKGPPGLDETYLRYLENQLRARFDLTGTPIRLRIEAASGLAASRAGRPPVGSEGTGPKRMS